MSDGWIKLHRKTLHCESVMKNADTIAVWVYILLQASHKDIEATFGTQRIVLHPGQFITGYKKIADDLNRNKSEIYRILKRYEVETMIETQSCSKGVLISVLNWDKYQVSETDFETETEQKRNRNATKVDTNKNKRNKKREEINIDASPVFINLPLNDGTFWGVTESKVTQYKSLYPSVDVEQELRNMVGWCDANKTKRKTKSGVERFIASWLAREQNRPHTQTKSNTPKNAFNSIPQSNYDFDAIEKLLEGK